MQRGGGRSVGGGGLGRLAHLLGQGVHLPARRFGGLLQGVLHGLSLPGGQGLGQAVQPGGAQGVQGGVLPFGEQLFHLLLGLPQGGEGLPAVPAVPQLPRQVSQHAAQLLGGFFRQGGVLQLLRRGVDGLGGLFHFLGELRLPPQHVVLGVGHKQQQDGRRPAGRRGDQGLYADPQGQGGLHIQAAQGVQGVLTLETGHFILPVPQGQGGLYPLPQAAGVRPAGRFLQRQRPAGPDQRPQGQRQGAQSDVFCPGGQGRQVGKPHHRRHQGQGGQQPPAQPRQRPLAAHPPPQGGKRPLHCLLPFRTRALRGRTKQAASRSSTAPAQNMKSMLSRAMPAKSI